MLGLLALAVPRLELELAAAITVLAVGGDRGPRRGRPVGVGWPCTSPSPAPWSRSPRWSTATTGPLAWLGGLLLASATWVRLYDVGVQAPEAYTLPTAVALLLVGLDRMRRAPELSSITALLAGLSLAMVPTLLWALVYPLSARAVVQSGWSAWPAGRRLRAALDRTRARRLGWAARRWCCASSRRTPSRHRSGCSSAPPASSSIASGITWEARLRDLRRAAGYLGRLR